MRFKYWKTGILLISILFLVFITPNTFADNQDRTYSSQIQFGLAGNQLYISVPLSLYDYYNGKITKLADDNEYSVKVEHPSYKPQEFSVQTKIDVYLGEIVLSPKSSK